MIILPLEEYAVVFLLSWFLSRPVNSLRYAVPTPTFAGLRAAQVGVEILPTANPWSPSELWRRLNGDPAICGWVNGNGSESS